MTITLDPAFWIDATGNVKARPGDGLDDRLADPSRALAFLRGQAGRAVALGFRRLVLPMWQGRARLQETWSASCWSSMMPHLRDLFRGGAIARLGAELDVSFVLYAGCFTDEADPHGESNYISEGGKVMLDAESDEHRRFIEREWGPLKSYGGARVREVWVDSASGYFSADGSDQGGAALQKFALGLGLKMGYEAHPMTLQNPEDAMQGGGLINVPATSCCMQEFMDRDIRKDWRADRATADRHIRVDEDGISDAALRDWAQRGFILDAAWWLSDATAARVRAARAIRVVAAGA